MTDSLTTTCEFSGLFPVIWSVYIMVNNMGTGGHEEVINMVHLGMLHPDKNTLHITPTKGIGMFFNTDTATFFQQPIYPDPLPPHWNSYVSPREITPINTTYYKVAN